MCGIVGYVGNDGGIDVLLNGLKRLEYRGYDSAGMAVLWNDELHIQKDRGKVQQLEESVYRGWPEDLRKNVHTGIAHTRWATHGPPTKENAHPHLDRSGKIALVHNGIIENCDQIRQRLQQEGHEFASQTDSETLAHLIGEYYQGDLLHAVCAALNQVEGTFGIAVISEDEPAKIIAARRGSPIAIGLGQDETVVASDAPAIVARTRRVIFLNDDDVAVVTGDDVDIRTIQNVPVNREVAHIDWDAKAAEKDGYEHFMLKEIFEQPTSLQNTIRGRLDEKQGTAKISGMALTPREMVEINRIIMIACGTSLNASMIGKYYFEDLADVPADVEQAAEFRYRNPLLTPRSMTLAISQSGETADTLAAVREAKQKGSLVAGICNAVGSTIARETGRGVYLHAGPEIGVASTKAFTSQLIVLLMTALKFGRCYRLSHQDGVDLCREIERVPELIENTLKENENIQDTARHYAEVEDAFFIGRGYLYPAALEGALKLKEISYIHAEGYHAAELKHGPIALLEENVPVIALVNDVPGKEKTLSNVQECRARSAPIIGVATEGDSTVDELCDDIIRVPRSSKFITPITTAIALQLFAYHVAKFRGAEIDQPRNLAKSVTVE